MPLCGPACGGSVRGRSRHPQLLHVRIDQRFLLLPIVRGHLPQLDDLAHDGYFKTCALGLAVDMLDVLGDAGLFFLKAFDPFDKALEPFGGAVDGLRCR